MRSVFVSGLVSIAIGIGSFGIAEVEAVEEVVVPIAIDSALRSVLL
jgi:hypothetical protein